VGDLTPEQMNEWLEDPGFAAYISNKFLEIAGIKGFWGFEINGKESRDTPNWDRVLMISKRDVSDNIQYISNRKEEREDDDVDRGVVYTDRFTLRKVTFRKVLHCREKDGETKFAIEKGLILNGGRWKNLAISRTFWGRTE
jgi:hypothetical protein